MIRVPEYIRDMGEARLLFKGKFQKRNRRTSLPLLQISNQTSDGAGET